MSCNRKVVFWTAPSARTSQIFLQYRLLCGVGVNSKRTPFAPILGYGNRRQRSRGLAGSLVSNVVDLRRAISGAELPERLSKMSRWDFGCCLFGCERRLETMQNIATRLGPTKICDLFLSRFSVLFGPFFCSTRAA